MKQTYRDLEIIIINDGSNDRSKFICQRLMQEDKRIILINNEKAVCGVEKARLNGINISTGNYMMFVDGDDYVDRNAVEKLLDQTNKDDSDIVIGNMKRVMGKHALIKKKMN